MSTMYQVEKCKLLDGSARMSIDASHAHTMRGMVIINVECYNGLPAAKSCMVSRLYWMPFTD